MVEFWFSEPIGKVRATADPGGESFTIAEAEALRDELDQAIQTARAATSEFRIVAEDDSEVVVSDRSGHRYRFSRVGPVATFESWMQHGERYRTGDAPPAVVACLREAGYRVVEHEFKEGSNRVQ